MGNYTFCIQGEDNTIYIFSPALNKFSIDCTFLKCDLYLL